MDRLAYTRETQESLSHATAIIGASREAGESFLQALAISPHDTVLLDAGLRGGIKDIREFTTRLLRSPQFGSYCLGVIFEAEKLTVEAQNALLKLLEEPPARVKLILFLSSEAGVLSTVLSRCRRYQAGENMQQQSEGFDLSDPLAQFCAAEQLAKDEQLSSQVAGWLASAYQQWCQAGRPISSVDEIERLWHVVEQLAGQTNKRLILEQLVLSST